MSGTPESITDFFHDTPSRIMGTETEYSVQAWELKEFDSLSVLRPYIAFTEPYVDLAWLVNGAKAYYDQVAAQDLHKSTDYRLFEYATPECTSATEAAIHEKAGERLAQLVAKEMRTSVFKRTAYTTVYSESYDEVLMQAASVGHHENYTTPLFDATIGNPRASLQLISYLASRPLWAGAGLVGQDGFHLSQKVRAMKYVKQPLLTLSHGNKHPLLNAKEGRGEAAIEIRSGDGNMSPWAIRTKLAMTSLVLRLIEHNQFPDIATIHNEKLLTDFALNASRDPNRAYTPEATKPLTATDQQLVIARAALEFALAQSGVPTEELDAASSVVEVLEQLKQWNKSDEVPESLSQKVDWAAKLHYIRGKLGQVGGIVNASNISAVAYDIYWEAIGKNSPSSQYYARFGNSIADAQIDLALMLPPQTRAQTRTEKLRAHRAVDIAKVSWDEVRFDEESTIPHFVQESPYLDPTSTISPPIFSRK